MIQPSKRDLLIIRGTTYDKTFKWTTKTGTNPPVDVDLTGYLLEAIFLENEEDPTSIIKTVSSDSLVDNLKISVTPLTGEYRIFMTAAETLTFPNRDAAVWYLKVTAPTTPPAENIFRLLQGKVTIKM